MTLLDPDCRHEWIANEGRGGKARYYRGLHPDYRNTPLHRAVCSKCGGGAYFTESAWATELELAEDEHATD